MGNYDDASSQSTPTMLRRNVYSRRALRPRPRPPCRSGLFGDLGHAGKHACHMLCSPSHVDIGLSHAAHDIVLSPTTALEGS